MFHNIDIGIKTFLRDAKLFTAIAGIQENYPEARMVIVDDGEQDEEKDAIYDDLRRVGHVVDILPFDSGFGKKSNRISELSDRDYLLVASDDFVFDKRAARGLFELQSVLDYDLTVDIASGRVSNRPYEFYLHIEKSDRGYLVKEIPVLGPNTGNCTLRAWSDPTNVFGTLITPWYLDCDLTVNYSLIRMRTLCVGWDDDVKIGGGEHGAFFFDCKTKNLRTVYVPGVSIEEQQVRDTSRYREFRNRAGNSERPCFDKRNIYKYVLGDGNVDYEKPIK
jgi:hypothetical protein